MSAITQEALSRLLGDDFTDLRPLGESGGLSRLFRAHKVSLDVDVVIKRMKMDPRSDARREARILTSLRHQYLPRVYGFETDAEGYCYTVMELIPGCTLRQYVARHGALDQKTAFRWLQQLSQAVAYMHGQKPSIIHSDIKPDNVMITPEGDVCLIDFNTSLEMKEGGVAALGATLNYAAPEQFNVPLKNFGKHPEILPPPQKAAYELAKAASGYGKVTAKTDIYALGATAYFMMTGYDPACWNQPLIDLTRYDITLGDPFRQTIARCMEKEPKKRFSSADELLRALGGLAKMDSRYKAWRRSCTVTALTVGAGLILSAFCVVWGVMLTRSEGSEAYNDLVAEAAAEKDPARQEQLLMEAIGVDRDRPEAYAHLGALLYRQGDYRQAVELLEDVNADGGGLTLESAREAMGQVQYVLASSHYQMENYEQALEAYGLAAELCDDNAAYQRDLAVCYARNGYADKAQNALTKLKRMKTEPGDAELAAGEILYSTGDFSGALAELKAAADRSEDAQVISRASVTAAYCCQHLGGSRLGEEIALLETACSRLGVPANGIQTRLLADAYLRQAAADRNQKTEYYELALECLQDLMDRGNPESAVRLNTALVLEYLGRYGEAESVLLKLAEDTPKDYMPRMRLALLYARVEGEKPAAQRNYQQVLAYHEQAEKLYTGTGAPDSEMLQLRELVYQLKK